MLPPSDDAPRLTLACCAARHSLIRASQCDINTHAWRRRNATAQRSVWRLRRRSGAWLRHVQLHDSTLHPRPSLYSLPAAIICVSQGSLCFRISAGLWRRRQRYNAVGRQANILRRDVNNPSHAQDSANIGLESQVDVTERRTGTARDSLEDIITWPKGRETGERRPAYVGPM